jgi:uncharacterized membrane protein
MAAFFGTTALCALLAVYSLVSWPQQEALYLLLGSLLYLAGSFLTTAVVNVPLNNALARVDSGSMDGARLWARYLTSWLEPCTNVVVVRGIGSLRLRALPVQSVTQGLD